MSNRPGLPAVLALVAGCAGTLLAQEPAGGADAAAQAAAPAAHTARHGPAARPKPDLMSLYATLATRRFVDLTHSFGPDTPHWKGFGEMKVRTLYTIPKDGFHVDEFCHVGQWGTHVDPPAHFHEGRKSVDQIDPKDMLMPLVVLDVHEQAARNPDYLLTLEDVQAWEARHGRIPEHAFVAMRTDWSKRWPNDAAMQNRDAAGVAHYPGWSMPVLKLLYEQRHIAASGHETTDTDGGLNATKDDDSMEPYSLGTENEQITYVLEGALHFWFGEDGAEELTVRAGEVIVIPSFLPHRALALEDTLDVDVFCPPRQDWLAGTDHYLRR